MEDLLQTHKLPPPQLPPAPPPFPTWPPPQSPQTRSLELPPPESVLVAIHPPYPPPNEPLNVPNARQNNHDFTMPVLAICLAAAFDTAIRSPHSSTLYPVSFNLLCLLMVLAFASIVVAKYIAPKHPNGASVLENLGVFFAVTGFFVTITTSFSLCLKVITWLIYVLSLLAILISNFYF